ncbi:hypothetical protein BDN71DRAFT_804057 [Pleurotus eryngii]|uniref:Uncharacterized protein n=1 Tax=Pleurotus eryngii TaxID=5323 RepID=A0A9P6CZV3_PLEER|nr:hypothetical protein BDN71DRAFT_804057 [Pleurotus eryngii]
MSGFYMPDPGQSHAPLFSGDPGSLERFFDEFERYAVTANLDDSTKVTYSRRYLDDNDDYRTWSRIAKIHPNDWKAFKNAVYDEYPGSRTSEFTSLSELEELIAEYRNQITTAAQLGKYRRRFTDICETLQETSVLSKREAIHQFLSAFPDDMQATIDPILLYFGTGEATARPRHHISRGPTYLQRQIDALDSGYRKDHGASSGGRNTARRQHHELDSPFSNPGRPESDKYAPNGISLDDSGHGDSQADK